MEGILVNAELSILVATAFSVGFLHTLLGPDHYIPFVAMARSNKWSSRRTFSITALCGLGHVIGSVVIGSIGLMLGSMLMQLEALEAFRGDAAAWLLIGFGLAYLTWGTIRAVRDIPHTHMHAHADGTVHSHLHRHDLEHRHVHKAIDIEEDKDRPGRLITPWLLFLIFVFGPCEVLIPLLMYPAAEANLFAIFAVVLAFSVATIGTMLACVMTLTFGLSLVRGPSLHRYSHALAGFAVLMCGVLVKFGL
jgi:nickel/cobalt exporter